MIVALVVLTIIAQTSWLVCFFYNYFCTRKRTETEKDNSQQHDDSSSIASTRVVYSLPFLSILRPFVEALIDFQEAQIFFVVSVQMAALIALKNPNHFQATSWQRLYDNLGALSALALGSIVSVVLVQLILMRAGSAKTSATIVFLGYITAYEVHYWWSTFYRLRTPVHYSFPVLTGLPECAGVAPTQYCFTTVGLISGLG